MERNFNNLVLTVLFATFFLACGKEDPARPDNPYPNEVVKGTAESLYNGVFWKYAIFSTEIEGFPGRFGLVFNHYSESNELRGQFAVNNITLNADTAYFLTEWVYANSNIDTTKQFCSYSSMLGDGDVAGDSYVPLNDLSMVLTVDEIKNHSHISGRFWGTMVKKIGEMEYDPASPDTIIFSEGVYEVKLE